MQAFAMLGGIILIAGIVVFLDWWGRKKTVSLAEPRSPR